MKTIEERAKESGSKELSYKEYEILKSFKGILSGYEIGYILGATEQKAIDDAEFECKAESYETGFAQGQEVGEREMLDKAIYWLNNFTNWKMNDNDCKDESIEESFRKAMEE